MVNISSIKSSKTIWPKRIWNATKKIAKKTYLIIPGAIVISLYSLNSEQLWRVNPSQPNIYGHMLTWGLWVGYETARNNAVSQGIQPNKASAAYLAAMAGGMLGAKVLLMGQFYDRITSFKDVFMHAGGIWYGGALGGIATLYLYAKAAKVSFLKLLDSLTPAALIGLGIGRIGCWSAGCCQGELLGLPTEPISAAFNISLGFLLTKLAKSAYFKGKSFLLGITGYALFRFIIEFFRHEPVIFGGLTLSQAISMGVLSIGAVLYAKFSKSTSTEPVIQQNKSPKITENPWQRFKLRIFELLSLTPLFYFAHFRTGIIIACINIIRTMKDGLVVAYRWAKKKMNNTKIGGDH